MHKHLYITTIQYNYKQNLGALHIKASNCTRILIPKDILAVFTNYPSVTKDQALDEMVFTLFHPVVHSSFNPSVSVTIENTIAHHQKQTLISRSGTFSAGLEPVVWLGKVLAWPLFTRHAPLLVNAWDWHLQRNVSLERKCFSVFYLLCFVISANYHR